MDVSPNILKGRQRYIVVICCSIAFDEDHLPRYLADVSRGPRNSKEHCKMHREMQSTSALPCMHGPSLGSRWCLDLTTRIS